jgi:hypothetical protein
LRATAGHDGSDGADIEVSPLDIDFGTLSAGDVATATITVSNVGLAESVLEVDSVEIGGADGGFTIIDGETAFDLYGGASEEFTVAFSPEGAYAQAAQAIVTSNDPDEARVPVSLLGEGMVPELEISPDPAAFATTYVGCTDDVEVTLTNVGTDLLLVTDLAFDGASMSMTQPNTLPLMLEAGETAPVSLSFIPEDEGSFSGVLTATSNEPVATRTADVTGVAKYAAERTDSWELDEDPPVDILFFVDQSCSMDDDQTSLAKNFSGFISQLSNYTTEWKVMVANDDDGCTNSGVLSESAADYEEKFSAAVAKGGGQYTEAGLIVSTRAIQNTDSGECNDAFMRSGALLHIIMVSDEPEQSPDSWDTYVDAIVAKKGDSSMVKLSAVAGPAPSGCSDGSNSAEYGSGYDQAASATGGEFLSICDNWASSVKTLADASVTQSEFTLSRTPVVDTIEVVVNGARRSANWSYDATTNAVIFSANIPEGGDSVDISYAVEATCG